ncbi:protein transporter Sec31 [Streptomyces sp. NPDC059590]|uniref:protein transporter Sec31 n=1 Tax=Streptomyces sp. NPDC059590 TaxID=3346877 RepID=UPI0036AEEA95
MKTRRQLRTRKVPHTIDGITKLVDEEYYVDIPVPPRDWDHAVLTGVQAGAAAFVAASVAWTTANIGDLLSNTVPVGVAYPVAIGYDAPWICCMALEWLARYDAERARAPRNAGHFALAVAMVAVIVHGVVADAAAAGIVGAVISALAKGLWTLVLAHTARPLDPRTQQWLTIRRNEIGARLALGGEQRRLARMEQHAAMLAADGQPAPDSPDTDQDKDPGQQDSLSGPARRMILARAQTMPHATDEEIAEHLAGHGITVTPDTVRAVLDDVVRPLRPPAGQGITDSVRAAIADGPADRDSVVARVQAQHPTAKRDDIRRIYDRIIKRQRAS